MFSSKGPNLHHLMVPATRLVSDLQIPDQFFLVSKYHVHVWLIHVGKISVVHSCVGNILKMVFIAAKTVGEIFPLGESSLLLYRHRLRSGSDLLL